MKHNLFSVQTKEKSRSLFFSVFVSGGVGQVFPGQFGKAWGIGKSHPPHKGIHQSQPTQQLVC